jgi:hypothetical protein
MTNSLINSYLSANGSDIARGQFIIILCLTVEELIFENHFSKDYRPGLSIFEGLCQ